MISGSLEANPLTVRGVLLALLVLSLAGAGCGGGAAGVTSTRPESTAPDLSAIELLLPIGAARVVVARPTELMAWSGLADVLQTLLAGSHADRLALEHGLDLKTLEAVAWADYGGAELIVARIDSGARELVERVGAQLMAGQLSSSDALVIRSGLWGNQHRILAAPNDQVVLLGVGDVGSEMTAVLAYLRSGRWPEGMGPLFRPPLTELRSALGESPMAIYMPRSLDLPLDTGFGRLMAGETAMGVAFASLGPPADGLMALEATFLGRFPEGASENFSRWIDDLADSDMGHILGIDAGRSTFTFGAEQGRIDLAITLDTTTFVSGLRDAFLVEISELSVHAREGPE